MKTLIKNNVYYIGIEDAHRKLFDQLVPLPDGTSYNSYLIYGSEKTAIIDTAYPPKKDEYIENLKSYSIDHLDYIICNHAEQDHSGSLADLLEMHKEAKVVTNAKCKELLISFHVLPEDRFIIVNDGESLSLGDKTLEFYMVPWVHWPDTMMTYLKEDKILFSCDFLGSHIAKSDLYVVDKEKVYEAAKRYYAEIMMPFRQQIKKYLAKIDTMDVDMIAPSHGPIYQDPSFILNAYKDWVSDGTKNKAVIAYASMYGSTELMINHVADKLKNNGIEVEIFDVVSADTGELAMSLVDATTVIIASPFVLAGAHPSVIYATYLINALRPKVKFVSIIGSFGWGGNMVNQIKDMLTNIKGEILEPVILKGLPRDQAYALLDNLTKEIIERHASLFKK